MIAHSAGVHARVQGAGRHHAGLTQHARRRVVLRDDLHRAAAGRLGRRRRGAARRHRVDRCHPEQPFFLRRGSWIANSHGVEIDTQWGGMANLFGGEGGFGFRASGRARRW